MRKIFLALVFCLFIFTAQILAQSESTKVLEMSDKTPCGVFIADMDEVYSRYKEVSDAKIYVIHYEGNHKIYGETRKLKPRKGDALNRAKEVSLYLTKSDYRAFKLPKNKVVLVSGGYRKDFMLEIWVVPKNAELPKLTPTLEAKDVKFRKGKPFRVRNYGLCYGG